MEVIGKKLVFTQPEVRHILWNHSGVPEVANDSEKQDFVDAIETHYSEVRCSGEKDSDVVVNNIPPSREMLARRILRQEHSGIEHVDTSTAEQVAGMKELHRIGKSAKSVMARRALEHEIQLQQEDTDN